jgi:response regulator of citrate/malate metabolism
MPDNNNEIESGMAETQVEADRSSLELYDAQRRRRDEADLNRPMTRREAHRIIDAIERLPPQPDYSAQRVAERVAESTAKAVRYLEWIAGMLLVMTGCMILIALRVLFWI